MLESKLHRERRKMIAPDRKERMRNMIAKKKKRGKNERKRDTEQRRQRAPRTRRGTQLKSRQKR